MVSFIWANFFAFEKIADSAYSMTDKFQTDHLFCGLVVGINLEFGF